MVDVTQRSELSLLDHDALSRAIENILDRHGEIQDWTILYTQRELGVRYPGIDFSTASTLAKIEDDPSLLAELRNGLGLEPRMAPAEADSFVAAAQTPAFAREQAYTTPQVIGRWSGVDPNRLAQVTDRFLESHGELADWTELYSPQELQAAYPNVGQGTASTLAKIATDPGLSKEFDQSLTADAIERMRAVPLPVRPEQRPDAGLPMPDPGIDPSASVNPMGSGIGM
ncbi:hypothetical protein H6G88_09040 [Bifidobacterium ruminantium]|uniref:hypothetical protein n=1 Tax=Bifidobacterium ruminantium TaxID=78346 RepID=UPI00195CFA00|nr:hypothetical protein [Bifidobacterium ruminantium]MBM6747424.1 hypothetical protein [Bifidobacterium ruminantium]